MNASDRPWGLRTDAAAGLIPSQPRAPSAGRIPAIARAHVRERYSGRTAVRRDLRLSEPGAEVAAIQPEGRAGERMTDPRLAGVALGVITGVRSTAGLTTIAQSASRFSRSTLLAAAGEAIADKVIDLPARTKVAPLAGRGVLGAASAAVFARRHGGSVVEAATIGAAAALASAFVFTRLRRFVTRNYDVPDAIMGLAEDAIVLAGSAWILRVSRASAPRRREHNES